MRKKRPFFARFSSWYLVLILLFTYLPIGYLVLFSFNAGKLRTSFQGFSLRWYEKMFSDRTMLESIFTFDSSLSTTSPS